MVTRRAKASSAGRNQQPSIKSDPEECPDPGKGANLPFRGAICVVAEPIVSASEETEDMADLKRLLRDLTREIERIAERNDVLERRLASISGALVGTVRVQGKRGERTTRFRRRTGRRGAPPKFNDAQAVQLRKDYERGATSAQLARKYKAALPTILSTLRRAGTTLRRGRPPK